jgi:hypothetical protein
MPSTPVYLALAAPGLFGWSFVPGWRYVDALEVDPSSVGRPEHYRAIDALGYVVWSNARTVADEFAAAGVPAVNIGEAWPAPAPPLPAKDVDVVTIGANRWAPVTRRALAGFRGTWRELPMLPNTQLMTELGRGRVFVHCPRIEGGSRVAAEARRMGTFCIGLASNRFAVGFDEASGGMLVERLGDVSAVVEQLLADPDDVAHRAARARAQSSEATNWGAFVDRVRAAIAAIGHEPAPRHPAWRQVTAELARRDADRERLLDAVRARRSVRVADGLSRLVRRDHRTT